MKTSDRITIDPNVRSGKPCIRGLRITVDDVLDYLAGGMSFEALLEDFPDLERDDLLAVCSSSSRSRPTVSGAGTSSA
jgi:uncharacterized protein (DUF433 family)